MTREGRFDVFRIPLDSLVRCSTPLGYRHRKCDYPARRSWRDRNLRRASLFPPGVDLRSGLLYVTCLWGGAAMAQSCGSLRRCAAPHSSQQFGICNLPLGSHGDAAVRCPLLLSRISSFLATPFSERHGRAVRNVANHAKFCAQVVRTDLSWMRRHWHKNHDRTIVSESRTERDLLRESTRDSGSRFALVGDACWAWRPIPRLVRSAAPGTRGETLPRNWTRASPMLASFPKPVGGSPEENHSVQTIPLCAAVPCIVEDPGLKAVLRIAGNSQDGIQAIGGFCGSRPSEPESCFNDDPRRFLRRSISGADRIWRSVSARVTKPMYCSVFMQTVTTGTLLA